jgi:hypothetical protein
MNGILFLGHLQRGEPVEIGQGVIEQDDVRRAFLEFLEVLGLGIDTLDREVQPAVAQSKLYQLRIGDVIFKHQDANLFLHV